MARLTILLLSMFILCYAVLGQAGFVIKKLEEINDEERAVLREGFKLPDSATIVEVKAYLH